MLTISKKKEAIRYRCVLFQYTYLYFLFFFFFSCHTPSIVSDFTAYTERPSSACDHYHFTFYIDDLVVIDFLFKWASDLILSMIIFSLLSSFVVFDRIFILVSNRWFNSSTRIWRRYIYIYIYICWLVVWLMLLFLFVGW